MLITGRQGWVISSVERAQRFPNATTGYMFSQYAPLEENGTEFYTLDNLKSNYLDACRTQPDTNVHSAGYVSSTDFVTQSPVNFVLNMLSRELPDQLALLRYAQGIGIPVSLVELGV